MTVHIITDAIIDDAAIRARYHIKMLPLSFYITTLLLALLHAAVYTMPH